MLLLKGQKNSVKCILGKRGDKMDVDGIAVIGMSGRFPGADSVEEFWDNLVHERETITFYSDEELKKAGIDDTLIQNPNYVKAKGVLKDIELFDAKFFGMSPGEAELTDPQHRLMLQEAWKALEDAGYPCYDYQGQIGVYVGCSMSSYMLLNVYPNIKKEISSGSLVAAIGNDKDSLSTTISYHMNLTGPSINIQSSSSTSLVAICTACQSILNYQSDMSIAGGVALGPPVVSGYLYEENGIVSKDGHCRPFDADANGFVPGMGLGLVVLKRLDKAIEDRDHIYAVIKGFSVNNDGANKISYHAPSVKRQTDVVVEAQEIADIQPETISYIECHGTGTKLGDPIEIAALKSAFARSTNKKRFCALGSVKSNIGHLDTAAGVAGFIKVCCALKEKMIPPTLHFQKLNPEISLKDSPFYVNTELHQWDSTGIPNRAGVTSLGMGGTNAHVILEAYDVEKVLREEEDSYVFVTSAKTQESLDVYTKKLVEYLNGHSEVFIGDVAYTLAVGRNAFPYRRALYYSRTKGLTGLADLNNMNSTTNYFTKKRKLAFLFTGQGAQYLNIGKQLYLTEKIYREAYDECDAIFYSFSGVSIKNIVFGEAEDYGRINETQYDQPVLVAFEYALAKLYSSWGINPDIMIGHSLGEYTAACLSGVLTLRDCFYMIHLRSKYMQEQKPGAMLVVHLSECEMKELLLQEDFKQLDLAEVNAPNICVVAGGLDEINKLILYLEQNGIQHSLRKVNHAFHSRLMKPMIDLLKEKYKKIQIHAPKIPFVSCFTGELVTVEELRNSEYWLNQLIQPVQFSKGLQTILNQGETIFLELSGVDILSTFVREQLRTNEFDRVIPSMSIRDRSEGCILQIQKAVGKLWTQGVSVHWNQFYANSPYYRISLPTYAFYNKRYWMNETKVNVIQLNEQVRTEKSDHDQIDLPDAVEQLTDTQQKIQAIWEEVLGVKSIGLKDDFFETGGHSLLATQLLSRIELAFGIRIQLKDIFFEFTIEHIAEILEKQKDIMFKKI